MLSVAAASGRIGYVFLNAKVLEDWRLSRVAAENPEAAARFVKDLIEKFRPDVVVTENIADRTRKGDDTKANILAMAVEAAKHELYDVSVLRRRTFRNKYLEAEALAERFPVLLFRVPEPRKAWDPEPKQTVIFEALVLALQVIEKDKDPTLF